MKQISKEEIRRADYVRTAHQLLDDVMHPSEDKRHLCIIVWDREDLEGIAFDVGAMLCSEELSPPFMVEGEVPSEESVQACTEHLFDWFDNQDLCNNPPTWSNFRDEAENFYNSLITKQEEDSSKNIIITIYFCNDCGIDFYIDSLDLGYCPNCGNPKAYVERREIGMKDIDRISKHIEALKEKLETSDDFYINKETAEYELDFMFGKLKD